MLRLRAKVLALIRGFFRERGVMEVETPCLESAPATDPCIEPIPAAGRYLRASPEFLMKRLLAACSEDIYQIGKVFRGQEIGALHNPEFTMLEWYRRGWDYRQLMGETDELLQQLLSLRKSLPSSSFVSYRELFVDTLAADPWVDEAGLFIARARERGYEAVRGYTEAADFLMDTIAREHFPANRLTFVHGYPPRQALLARVKEDVAERFEVYLGAVELVNGYTELTDAEECRNRFARDNDSCARMGRAPRVTAKALIDALERGFPDCAGASLGVDRTLMSIARAGDISSTLSFDWRHA